MKNVSSHLLYFKREQLDIKVGFGLVHQKSNQLINLIPNFLHPVEIEFYKNLNQERRKKSYILGRVAAKLALQRLVIQSLDTINIDRGIFGFPVVNNCFETEKLQVSISHCGSLAVALAFPEKHPLGIDIEQIRSDECDFLTGYYTDSEREILYQNKLDNPTGYTLLWSIKESISKILKTGLMVDFKIYEINKLERRHGFYSCTFTHCYQYKAISKQLGNYFISIVLPKKSYTEIGKNNIYTLCENLSKIFAVSENCDHTLT